MVLKYSVSMLDNPNKILEKPLNLLKTTKNNMEKIAHFM